MTRILRTLAVLAAALVLSVAAFAPSTAAGSGDLPLRGVIVGGGNVQPDTSCPLGIRTMVWGTGHVTHLGLTTMTGSHCTPPPGADITGGVQTFVAANGDTLEVTYTATVKPFEPVEGAVMEGPGETPITGGTGRFAGASGEFIACMRGILHFTAPMELSWEIDGEISY
jgi:hypothetical protein